ncbi:MAG: hypothetical protein NT069_26710 [Planctomycetota bacterium]|nr:hypothetical protein [Planctomycetota bacterium]
MLNLPEPLRRLIWPSLSLVAGLLVLAAAVYYLKVWLRDRADDSGGQLLLLTEYREMVRRGQLSEEEFRKIKGRMAAALGVTPLREASISPTDVSPPVEGDTEPESEHRT